MGCARRLTIRVFLLVVLAVVGACETTVERSEFPEFTYLHHPPIPLDVASIALEEAYRSPLTAPNIEHLFPTSPAEAVGRWVADRLVAVGVQRVARVTLLDASVVATRLERREGVEDLLWVEPNERIDARLKISVEVIDETGASLAFATAEVVRSRSLAEDLTLNERDAIYFELTEALMNDLNATLEQNIRDYLGAYVR
jgi:hypothetical protein